MSFRVLVTGANGAVGHSLVEALNHDYEVLQGFRQAPTTNAAMISYGDIRQGCRIDTSLDVIVHCAALAHQLQGACAKTYDAVNTQGTVHMIEAGLAAGMKRFIFMSSIKVLGEYTQDRPFNENTPANPQDDYARSKWAAEQCVMDLSTRYGFEYVIIRPPLIVGGDKTLGNIAALISAIKRGVPLPLKTIRNTRSMLHIQNLCSFVALCIWHPKAANETFCIGDHNFTTPEFVHFVCQQHDLQPKLFACPPSWLKLAGMLAGKREKIGKLCGSLAIEPSKAKQLLGWTPDENVYTQKNHS